MEEIYGVARRILGVDELRSRNGTARNVALVVERRSEFVVIVVRGLNVSRVDHAREYLTGNLPHSVFEFGVISAYDFAVVSERRNEFVAYLVINRFTFGVGTLLYAYRRVYKLFFKEHRIVFGVERNRLRYLGDIRNLEHIVRGSVCRHEVERHMICLFVYNEFRRKHMTVSAAVITRF